MPEPDCRPLIGEDTAKRLCIELVATYQQEQIRAKKMASDALITSVLAAALTDPDDIAIAEDTLGIDSLALLDVVMHLTRYFGLDATGVEDYLLVQKTLGDWSKLVAAHFEKVGAEAQITFPTSGSGGPQKHITHTEAHLAAEIDALIRDIFDTAPPVTQVISAVAPHHIYGFLWSVLLPQRLGVACKDLYRAAPSAVVRKAAEGSIVLATPFLWEEYARFGLRMPDGVIGISSGGPTSSKTWQAAADVGLSKLIEVFGATETGGVGWRDQENAPLTLLSHLTHEDDGLQRNTDGTECPLQDKLDWVTGRSFRVQGRQDRVVQIAGTNVSLDVVEETLRTSGLAQSVAVRPDGARLKAFVVPKDSHDSQIDAQLRKHLLRLPAVARPDHFTFGDRLPRNAMGKLQDW